MGLFDFFKKKNTQQNSTGQSTQTNNDIDNAQQEFINNSTANAEKIIEGFGEKYNKAFDYSVKSLETLDTLLDNFADYAEEMGDEMKQNLIAQAGSYIFEVARRNFGGKYFWYDQMNQPILVTGLPNYEISLVAFNKVKMRIENGIEDNIPFFFQGYSERVLKAKTGDRAMII
ncbi:hypothetical protein [Soonwooa sp.]|uniref:hypothetical protein n=1 Tax=Soonwooa sp. TaxID=1938592 RepID=UPI002631E978|nr:hypothetical protein [Soonwooa sp.]